MRSVSFYELIYMIHMDDDWALKQFLKQFKPIIMNLVNISINPFPRYYAIKEDLVQEAMIVLLESIDSYRESYDCPPQAYFSVVLKRKIMHDIQKYIRKNSLRTHDMISLDTQVNERETYYDVTPYQNSMENPEYYMNYKMLEDAVNQMANKLTYNETETLNMWLKDVNYKDASKALGISYKAYDGRLQRVKRKVSNFVNNAYVA